MCPFIMIADMETMQVRNNSIVKIDKRTGLVREDEDRNEMFTDAVESSSDESVENEYSNEEESED